MSALYSREVSALYWQGLIFLDNSVYVLVSALLEAGCANCFVVGVKQARKY